MFSWCLSCGMRKYGFGVNANCKDLDIYVLIGSQSTRKWTRIKVNLFSFWSIRSHRFGQFVLIWSIRPHCSVNSNSFWSARTYFDQLVLTVLVNSFSFSDFSCGKYAHWTRNETQNKRMHYLKTQTPKYRIPVTSQLTTSIHTSNSKEKYRII